MSTGERGPHGDHGQKGDTGATGARGATGKTSVGEWVRWALTLAACAVTLWSVNAVSHEGDVRHEADQKSLAQREATDKRLSRAVQGNCIVLGVLLEGRADRDATVKLFDPIRRENPQQFDKLVERAEKQDGRLAKAVPLLSCNVPDAVLQSLNNVKE